MRNKIILAAILLLWLLLFSCDPSDSPFKIKGTVFLAPGIVEGPIAVGFIDQDIFSAYTPDYKWTDRFSDSYMKLENGNIFEFSGVRVGDYLILAFIDTDGNDLWSYDSHQGKMEDFGVYPMASGLHHFEYPLSNANIIIDNPITSNIYYDDPSDDVTGSSYRDYDLDHVSYDFDTDLIRITITFSNGVITPGGGSNGDELDGYIHFDVDTNGLEADGIGFYDTSLYYNYYIYFNSYSSGYLTLYDYTNTMITASIYCEITDDVNTVYLEVSKTTINFNTQMEIGVVVSNLYDVNNANPYHDGMGPLIVTE